MYVLFQASKTAFDIVYEYLPMLEEHKACMGMRNTKFIGSYFLRGGEAGGIREEGHRSLESRPKLFVFKELSEANMANV